MLKDFRKLPRLIISINTVYFMCVIELNPDYWKTKMMKNPFSAPNFCHYYLGNSIIVLFMRLYMIVNCRN